MEFDNSHEPTKSYTTIKNIVIVKTSE